MKIKTELLAGFFVVWVCLSGLLLYADLRHDRSERDRSNQIAADLTNNALANTLFQSMSQGHKGADVQAILDAISALPGFRRAAVTDLNARLRWSAGAPQTDRDADRALIDAALASGTAFRTTPETRLVVRLLRRQAVCSTCHTGTSPWVGATLTEAGADPQAHAAQTRDNFAMLLVALGTGALGLTGTWLFLNRSLVRPLSDMAARFQAITPENWTAARIQVSDNTGEIGVLATRFNAMLNRLAEAEDRLVQDMVARKQADYEREGILRTALDGFATVDLQGRIVDVNDAYCQLHDYSRAELMTMTIADLAAVEKPPDIVAHLRQVVADGQDRFETRHRRKDGRVMDLEVSAKDAGHGRVFVFVRDITARKAAEERLAQSEAQLRQSQKMEAVGRLAGGIAHDFNNLLTVILGYSQSMLESMNANEPLRADVEEVWKAGTRAASLTRQMLAFSRKQVLELKVLDINTVAADTRNMLKRLIGEDIELSVITNPHPARANVDQGHMEQVLLNLAVNARDAMPAGGRLTIGVDVMELDEPYVHMHGTVQPGTYVVLSVSDTGIGMSEDVLAHLFEPFFTTKERGKGTGLGLSTVYGIVMQSGGLISVHSTIGTGTAFNVYLPYIGDAVAAETAAESTSAVFAGTAVILLVEDDHLVRKATGRMLAHDGFTILEAATGEEALAICQQHRGPIDLMLTDMVLPKMTGPELAAQVESARPETRVVFMSGYSDHALLANDRLHMGSPFIQKPFSSTTLTLTIRTALAMPRRRA